jgi:hypothetical protein
MNMQVTDSGEAESLRKELLTELADEEGHGRQDQFRPGSFGCHELLDRLSILTSNLDEFIVQHPSCLRNPAWFALAHQAMSALTDLYQRIGASHLDDASTATSLNGTAPSTLANKS